MQKVVPCSRSQFPHEQQAHFSYAQKKNEAQLQLHNLQEFQGQIPTEQGILNEAESLFHPPQYYRNNQHTQHQQSYTPASYHREII